MKIHDVMSIICTALVLCAVAFVLPAGAQAAANVTGTWKVAVQTAQASGSPTFTLKQDGEKVSGTYKGLLGEAPVKGTIKGNAFQLTFTASGGGQSLQVEYDGTVNGNAMKGTVKLGALGGGTFTGQKQ